MAQNDDGGAPAGPAIDAAAGHGLAGGGRPRPAEAADGPLSDAALAAEERRSALRTIRRVIPYIWPADAPWVRRRLVLALTLLVMAKLISVSTPFFFKAAVDGLSGVHRDDGWLLGLGAVALTVAYGAARFLNTGFQELRDVVFARVGVRALRQLATETFGHIHALSLRYHLQRRTGALSRVMERGVKGVDFLLRFLVFSIGPLVLELALVGIVLFWFFDIWYLVVVAVTILLYVIFTTQVTEWRVRQRKEMNDRDNEANQKAIDSLLNYETVKYFNAEGREAARYDKAMAGYGRAALKTAWSLSALNAGQGFIITAGIVIVMVMAARGVMAGSLTVGDFVMVNAYMLQITLPLGFLGTVYREIRQALVDMGEMFDLLEQPAEVIDRPGAPALVIAGGEVVFDDVRFGYDPGREILRGLSFRAAPGETVALVGPSGAGKSTVGRLLFRFYDVTGGAIRIDGQDIREVTQSSLHAAIGVVPQDTVLFNDTIGYNIGYGAAEASFEEVERAARAARIADFVRGLPEGYDTPVGERGLKLSGGEKQRVGIARALLKNPPILLLDEATSALDTQTEEAIRASLADLGRGRTVLTIAHRLSTIVDADRILVVDGGRVVEQGRHADLLAEGGLYAAMWARQAREEASLPPPAPDTAG